MIVCLIFKLKLVTVVTCKCQAGAGVSLFCIAPILPLVPTQPPMQRVPGALSLGAKWQGMILITHLQLVLRVRINGTVPYFHQTVQLEMNLDVL